MLEEGEAFLEQAWFNQRRRSKQLHHHFRLLGPQQQCSNVFCQLLTPKEAIVSLAFYAGILEGQTPHLRGKKRKRPNNS